MTHLRARPGVYYERADADRRRHRRAAHRHRRLRRHRASAARSTRRCRSSRGGSSRRVRRPHRAAATSPTRCARSSRTAGAAAGSCASPSRRRAAAAGGVIGDGAADGAGVAHRGVEPRRLGQRAGARGSASGDAARRARPRADAAGVLRVDSADSRGTVGSFAQWTLVELRVDRVRERAAWSAVDPSCGRSVDRRLRRRSPCTPRRASSRRLPARRLRARRARRVFDRPVDRAAAIRATARASLTAPWSLVRRSRASGTPSRRRTCRAVSPSTTCRGRRCREPVPIAAVVIREAARLRLAAARDLFAARRRRDRRSRGGADGLAALGVSRLHRRGVSAAGDDDAAALRKRRGLAALESRRGRRSSRSRTSTSSPRPVATPTPPPPCGPDPCLPPPPPAVPLSRVAVGDLPPRFSRRRSLIACSRALVEHCERRRDRVALLDPPSRAATGLGIERRAAGGCASTRSYAALLLTRGSDVVDPLRRRGGARRRAAIPPCGHVAGQSRHRPARRRARGAGQRAAELGAGRRRSPSTTRSTACSIRAGINVLRAQPGRGAAGPRRAHALVATRTGASSTSAGC